MTKRRTVKTKRKARRTLPINVDDLPPHLIEQFLRKLKDHGTTIDTFIKLSIRSYMRSGSVFALEDTITFGKYEGNKLEDVIRINPGYVLWMLENTTNFKVTPAAYGLLEMILNEQVESAEVIRPNSPISLND